MDGLNNKIGPEGTLEYIKEKHWLWSCIGDLKSLCEGSSDCPLNPDIEG